MDHWKGLSIVFNCWNFCFKVITQWWAMVDFLTLNGPIFHKVIKILIKIFVVINQKLCNICGQKLVWMVSTIGTTNTPSLVKIWEVTQNSLLIWHGFCWFDFTHNSCNIGRSALPDMYVLVLRHCACGHHYHAKHDCLYCN